MTPFYVNFILVSTLVLVRWPEASNAKLFPHDGLSSLETTAGKNSSFLDGATQGAEMFSTRTGQSKILEGEFMEEILLQNSSYQRRSNHESQGEKRQMQKNDERYKILSSSEILNRLQDLVAKYPAFSTLTTTQEWFGLPRAGTNNDCDFDEDYKGSYQGQRGAASNIEDFAEHSGCNVYVLVIQDKDAFPDDVDVKLAGNQDFYLGTEDGWWKKPAAGDNSDSNGSGNKQYFKSGWKYLPDVFLSGSVHGNERVGPTSLLEMAELLLEAASCLSLPRMRYSPIAKPKRNGEYSKGDNSNGNNGNNTLSNIQHLKDYEMWKEDLVSAKMCRSSLSERGITHRQRKWLARLVSTRRTIILPSANAPGYSRNERTEGEIDPNRDFPFDILPENDRECMQTVAGRSINEIFRSHLFPIGLTFHGGQEVIGYEWGSPTYYEKDAPDAIAQDTIAGGYSRYANGFPQHVAYDYGSMNDKVYYVRGGMEDWAFAGSWDPDRVVQCRPRTFGGNYPAEKTTYNNSTLRAFNMLIETSDMKNPSRDSLGTRSAPLVSSNGSNNGHVARNIRLALLAMDVAEPYVVIKGVEGMTLRDEDVVPGVNFRRYDGGSFFENVRTVWVPERYNGGSDKRLRWLNTGNHEKHKQGGHEQRRIENAPVIVTWTVGGAFDIDRTSLVYGPWDALPQDLADPIDGFYPSYDTLDALKSFTIISPTNIGNSPEIHGRSRWHAKGPSPKSSAAKEPNPIFKTAIDISMYPPGTSLAIFARAKVDQGWSKPISKNVEPISGPVSHIVNSRTNPSYFAKNARKIVRGRKNNFWYSTPITIIVGSLDEERRVQSEGIVNNAPISASNGRVKVVHVNARFGGVPSMMGRKRPAPVASNETAVSYNKVIISFIMFVAMTGMWLVIKRTRNNFHWRQMQQASDSDNDFATDVSRNRHQNGTGEFGNSDGIGEE